MGNNEPSATGILAERLQSEATFWYAMMADAASVLFWVAVLATIAVGFLWLSNIIEHLNLNKGWRHAVAFAGLFLLARGLSAGGAYLRVLSPSYEPGEAAFGAAWMLLSLVLLVGPFALIFASRNFKNT
ncbi:hypothetical protein [Ectopseudomonas mendocina]|uniref:Uncharacterized protein n=1 Tax=Ectopseudomonas mendocina S5.2 TaxID=1225174 RepID=A0ABN4J2R9_ECTME|nr:hypothetical protein [Pseudomonas mendocina]ALN21767.1 hypothetical protein DW68_024115 [Pseudomonas mendocina S5.2]KER98175.1 hypothetical protein HN51_25610 [Pseudomonas mendocina]